MIIHGTNLLTWDEGFAGTIPSVVYEGRELVQDPDASMATPSYPAAATGRYLCNGTTVNLANVPHLFKITAEDAVDSYDGQTGETKRQIGVIAFDGSETWYYHTGQHAFRTPIADMAVMNWNTNCVFSHGIPITSTSQVGARFGGNNNYFYWFVGLDNPMNDIPTFKQYLSDEAANGTPVTIYYLLAAEATETNTAQILTAVKGTNTIERTYGAAADVTADVRTLPDLGLIYDRTYNDVEQLKRKLEQLRHGTVTSDLINELGNDHKGALNASDLNRIETGIIWLGDEYGWTPSVSASWQVGDKPSPSDIAAIRSDLLDIKDVIPRGILQPPLPNPPDTLTTWQDLNAVEKIIEIYHKNE